MHLLPRLAGLPALLLVASWLFACGGEDSSRSEEPTYDGPVLARAPVELPGDGDSDSDEGSDNPWLSGFAGTEPTEPGSPDPGGAGGSDTESPEPSSPPPSPAQLLLTRYYEGLGNDKALQITNLGDEGVELSRCRLTTYVNGNTSPYRNSLLSGWLEAGASVVLCGTGAGGPLLDHCAGTSSAIAYNGNDAVLLRCDELVVDSFGRLGEDPGTSWTSNGVSTLNAHLVRLCRVSGGDTVADDVFDPSLEWRSAALDDFSTFGSRVCPDPDEPPPEPDDWEPLEAELGTLMCPQDELHVDSE